MCTRFTSGSPDEGNGLERRAPRARTAWKLRALLETNEPVDFVSVYRPGTPQTVRGLDLPTDVLRPIYHDNLAKLLGEPRPLKCSGALARVASLRSHTRAQADQARLDEIKAALATACR